MSRLRTIREALGLSQKAMGDRLGYSQAAIATHESAGTESRRITIMLDQIERELAASASSSPDAAEPPAPASAGAGLASMGGAA